MDKRLRTNRVEELNEDIMALKRSIEADTLLLKTESTSVDMRIAIRGQIAANTNRLTALEIERHDLRDHISSKAVSAEQNVLYSRQRRRDGLKFVLDINKKAKPRRASSYSYAHWEQVKEYFSVILGSLGTASNGGLPDELLTALHDYLSCASVCFRSITERNEETRVHFIAPIINMVGSFFRGDMQILSEEHISGNRLRAYGHYQFVLKRAGKHICIVEAKKEDILQGKTQCLIGCELLCDVEDVQVSYGIATNYLEWCFLKDEPHVITEEMLVVSLENMRPTKESLRIIANKIIGILE